MVFEYLNKYIGKDPSTVGNWFNPVDESRILEAEKLLGFAFPSDLVLFWRNVGEGCLPICETSDKDKDARYWLGSNRIMGPEEVAEFYLKQGDYEFISEHELSENELPFFNLSDDIFLVMSLSKEDFASIRYYGVKVANNLEEFMQLLYKQGPEFLDAFE